MVRSRGSRVAFAAGNLRAPRPVPRPSTDGCLPQPVHGGGRMNRRRALIAAVAVAGVAVSLSVPTANARPAAHGKTVKPSLYSSLQWRNIGPQLGGRSLA